MTACKLCDILTTSCENLAIENEELKDQLKYANEVLSKQVEELNKTAQRILKNREKKNESV